MRSDLVMMACLAAFAVAMVATADYSSSSPEASDPAQASAAPADSTPAAQGTDPAQDLAPPSGTTVSSTEDASTPVTPPAAAPAGTGTIDCSADCATLAGHRWAELHEIVDPDDCGGIDSAAFIEGCRAYAEEQTSLGADRDSMRKLGER